MSQGGIATVCQADDLKHELKVALKVLKPELAAVVGAERFLTEIKTTANLQHTHILPLFDSGEVDRFLFYVMPFVEGETLADRLVSGGLRHDEAIAIGNDVVFGLAAGVWTQNIGRAISMADRLKAGTVWVNTYRAVSYMSPFGGYKRSGLGRESGQEMIKEYLQHKSIWIETSNAEAPNPFIMR